MGLGETILSNITISFKAIIDKIFLTYRPALPYILMTFNNVFAWREFAH